MKGTLLLLVCVLNLYDVHSNMSEAQMKAALKLVRNVCQPKFKVASEPIDSLRQGKWDVEKNTKCYLWCILNMYKLMTKDNHFDYEVGIATVKSQAPDSMQATIVPTLGNCRNAIQTFSDKCEAGYEMAKCIYDDDPPHYFLP